MKYTIEKLWNGSIVPVRQCGADDPDVEELLNLMRRNRDALNQKLDAQQMDIFKRYVDCTEEYVYSISMHAFQDGFCLASKLLAESLSG